MNRLQQLLTDQFTSKMANLVIGYEKGTEDKRRPAFVSDPRDLERLIFDEKCNQNLSSYLTKQEFRAYQNIVVFASMPTIRSVIRLTSENQLKEKNLTFIVNSPDRELDAIASVDELAKYYDKEKIISPSENELMLKFDAMSREERFAFWKDQFSSCIKCYACRAACPMCYCTRCTVEINQPQWITVPSTLLGNFEWHVMRVMHMAGRCVDCSACENACPLSIPLNIITRRMIKDLEVSFGPDILSVENKNVLNTFQPDDKENFIH
jgi:ferredoxin